MKMLALTMLSSSLRSLELEPLAYSSFTLLRAAQNKTSLLKVFLKTHFLARFSGASKILDDSSNCSVCCNATGKIAGIRGWMLFSGIRQII